MRLLVFLLVAANLAFFAWTQGYLGEPENPDALRLAQQLKADQLRVLSRDEAPKSAPPPAAAAAKPAPDKCLVWGGLTAATAEQVESMLVERFAGLRRTRHVVPEASSWWIFIPPLTSKTVPAEKDQSPRASEATAFATSSGVPHRFCGMRPSVIRRSNLNLLLVVSSVFMRPGRIS